MSAPNGGASELPLTLERVNPGPIPGSSPHQVLSPGEILAVLLTGACVLGEKPALLQSEGREMADYDGAETMVAVVNTCLGMAEKWGYVEDRGATQAAWDFTLAERLTDVPEGPECAQYCRDYYTAWQDDQANNLQEAI